MNEEDKLFIPYCSSLRSQSQCTFENRILLFNKIQV